MFQTTKHRRYPVLDGLRGVAALVVVERHTAAFFDGMRFPHGFLAVDLFFIMSGFVLASSYGDKMVSGLLSQKQFIIKRFIRLYPLYIIGLLLATSYLMVKATLSSDEKFINVGVTFLFNLFYLPTPQAFALEHNAIFMPGSAWSLFQEMIASALFCLLIFKLTTRFTAALAIIGAVLMIRAAVSHQTADIGFYWDSMDGGFGRVLYSFFIGVILFQFRNTFNPRRAAAWCIVPILAFIIVTALPITAENELAYHLFAIIFILPFIVLFSVSIEPNSKIDRVHDILGAASYPLYVIHIPLFWWTIGTAKRLMGVDTLETPMIFGVLFVTLLTCIALALDRFYDIPIRRYLGYRFDRAPQTHQNQTAQFEH